MTDSMSSFRFRATGTPDTDRYITRGPRGTYAEFDGFRDGEFLYVVRDQEWAHLDTEQESLMLRSFLRIAASQIWASVGSPIVWLFESTADADGLRDEIAGMVETCRAEFPDASITLRIVGTGISASAPSPEDERNSPGLLALGRPIGFADDAQWRFLLEVGGAKVALEGAEARLWLALRTKPAETGRPVTAIEANRIVRPRGGLSLLRAKGLILEWPKGGDVAVSLGRLRVLPLQTFASDDGGSSVHAVAGSADSSVTTSVSVAARALVTLGPLYNDVAETARIAWNRAELDGVDTRRAIGDFGRELPRLLARDVVYLDFAAHECVSDVVPDPSPLDVEIEPSADLGFLAVGLVVDASDGRPTLVRVGGRLEALTADEGGLWQVVRGLNPFHGPNAPELQELRGVARHRQVGDVELNLERLIQRGLVRHLRGAHVLRSLSAMRVRPLLAGLENVVHRPAGGQPQRQWLLGTKHDQRTVARVPETGAAIWGASGAELPSLQHAVSMLVRKPDLGEVSFVLGCMRSLVDEHAAYFDTVGEPSASDAAVEARS